MYIRRACLEQLGLFDADRFGRGYGEENDFCMHAASKGWRSMLAGDVLVFHEGAVSFSDERDALMQAAERILLEAHPDYLQKVREFIASDAPGALRDAVDRARFERGADEAGHVLAERADERARLRAGLSDLDALTRGLAHAEALVAERDAAILERNEEIARLRSGLSHAESLAFARAEELERIRGSRMWKCMSFMLRLKS